MSNKIIPVLKKKIEEQPIYGELDPETRRNIIKEELQFYVLNFIYHHSEYGKWIMYGGSALRICHDLNRMSVDLDFETPYEIDAKFLNNLEKEIEEHFSKTYSTNPDFLSIAINSDRGLTLKFNIGDELDLGHPSKQVHVKIDLNYFVAPKTVTERRPINHDQLSFVILAYNMSALMASKIAAIFLRDQRGVGKNFYNYKGRDIYDLLWYMGKKITPDFDYLTAKKIDIKDPKKLFDKLTIDILNYEKMDELLKEDLLYLFDNRIYIENWLENWRETYLRLLDEYKINTVTELDDEEGIVIHQDFSTDNFSFIYRYKTRENRLVWIIYTISDYWIDFSDGDLTIEIDRNLENKMKFSNDGWSSKPVPTDKLKQYATLFYQKTEKYLQKTNRIILGEEMRTKVIRMTAKNLNQKEQIVLNKSALISSGLDDLLK